jgi:hypothetical protein
MESAACFLANVAYEVERCGISHDSVFPSTEIQVPALRTAISQNNRLLEELPREAEEEEKREGEKEETMSFSMKRYGDILVRTLSSDEEELVGAPVDYLAARRKRVSSCYFGEDDQLGDIRDLRKVISSSFKRFLQASHSQQGK